MAYQNSRVEQFSIVGDFFVENAREGAYWVGAVHFLRSATQDGVWSNRPTRCTPFHCKSKRLWRLYV